MAKRGRKPQVAEVKLKNLLEKEDEDKPDTLNLATLDKELTKVNSDVANILIRGSSPSLVDLSWKLYEQYKAGDLSEVVSDEQELKFYCDFKKKELVMRFIAFLDLASKAILNQQKLDLASVKEISSAMTSVASLINNFLGEANKIVKHDHIHEIRQIEDPDELNKRIQENQKKLQAIECEFEMVKTTEDSSL